MSARRVLLAACAAAGALAVAPAGASAAPTPAWSVDSLPTPTNFVPGDESGKAGFQAFIVNSGGIVTDQSEITITDTLPAGLGVKKVELHPPRSSNSNIDSDCETQVVGDVSTVTCKVTDALLPAKEPAKLYPGDELLLEIRVSVPPTASGTLVNQVEVQGGGAAPVIIESENPASAETASAGFQEYRAELTDSRGLAATGAASHPYQFTTTFAVNVNTSPPGSSYPFAPAGGDLKDIEVSLPPGLIANPTAIGRCSIQDFNTVHGVSPEQGVNYTPNDCPEDSAVGVIATWQKEGKGGIYKAPIYNLAPPKGMPAQLGFQIVGVPIYIDSRVRTASDYGVTGFLRNVTEAQRVTAARVTLWGTPWEASHDPLRGECAEIRGECPAKDPSEEVEPRAFWRLPSTCANPLAITMEFSTWAQPPAAASATSGVPQPTDCAAPDFSPTIESRPTTSAADSPSGLHFNLHLPQMAQEDEADEFEGPGEADLKDARVTLPRGLVVNPASASGRQACSPTQIGLTTPLGQVPPSFNEAPAACPDAAKVGNVEVNTPLLDHPLAGSVYLATQEENPFRSLLAIYIALEDPQSGIVAKLAGKVTLDPVTGQLTTTVDEGPQVPFEDFTFDFFDGPRAPLRTPMACGAHTTTSEMVPWSSPSGPSAAPADSFQVTAGPAGPCPTGALDPKLSAGLANPTAGTYSPFSLRLTRADGTGEFGGLSTVAPLGLVAKLAGVPYCPEAAITQAAARKQPGTGAAEVSQSSCPASSQVGTTTAGAGAGPAPYFTGGSVYLAGPYRGAPLSLLAIIPAVAGPFDLGVVTNRIALRVNSETAQVIAEADPLPTILSGIPLDVRDIRVNLDRPNFTLAPTSCEPKSVSATVLGISGQSATVADRFQVGGCRALRFKPGLSLKLKGATKRGGHPALRAVVTYPKGAYANIARASVALPHSEFLAQAHIRTICTRVQFAADACPKGSIYGKAKATSPLLDAPLSGPVYLRSSSNPLPDMVIALKGQIDIDLVGRIDSHNAGIRTTFDTVPDAAVAKFVLEMPGGKKSLLENSRNICNHTNRATVRTKAHNGRVRNFRSVVRDSCKGKGKGKAERDR